MKNCIEKRAKISLSLYPLPANVRKLYATTILLYQNQKYARYSAKALGLSFFARVLYALLDTNAAIYFLYSIATLKTLGRNVYLDTIYICNFLTDIRFFVYVNCLNTCYLFSTQVNIVNKLCKISINKTIYFCILSMTILYIYSEFMLHMQLFKILKNHKKDETLIQATKHSHIHKNVSSYTNIA